MTPRRRPPLVFLLLAAAFAAGCQASLAPVRPQGEVEDPARVRVVSFNAWLLPIASDDLGERLERLPAALRAEQADVVCLQEVWLGAHADALARALAPALPHNVRSGGGLLLLSRWPVRARRFVAYPTEDLALTERLAGKGLMDVVLETPRGPLRVINTHLALDREPDARGHARQLAALRRHLDGVRDLPLVLAGDLNLSAGGGGAPLSPAWRSFVETAGLSDVWQPARAAGGGWSRRPRTRVGWPRGAGPGRGWDPDTLLFRAGPRRRLVLRTRRIALDEVATALSDHNLLRATWVQEP